MPWLRGFAAAKRPNLQKKTLEAAAALRGHLVSAEDPGNSPRRFDLAGQPAARQLLIERPGKDRLELLDGRIVAHSVERQLDDRLHRRAELDLEALRLDQPEIFLGRLFGVEC